MSQKITMIGAGVAGVTAAFALAKSGFEVEVFEARDTVRREGLGIQIGANAVAALAEMGLEAKALGGVMTEAVTLYDVYSETRLQRLELGMAMKARYGACSHYFARADLVQSIADCAEAASARFHFGEALDSSQIDADLVINAAGAKSDLRRDLGADLFESEFLTWRGLLPRKTGISASRVDCGRGFHVVTYPIASLDAQNFVAVIDKRIYGEGRDGFLKAFQGTYLVKEIEGLHSDFIAPLYMGASDFGGNLLGKTFVNIGDAAHPMVPFLAQGAGQAIEDAFVLAKLMRDGTNDLPNRMKGVRQKRAERVQRKSKNMTNIYHAAPKSLARGAQKRAFSIFDQSASLAYLPFDWLYKLPK